MPPCESFVGNLHLAEEQQEPSTRSRGLPTHLYLTRRQSRPPLLLRSPCIDQKRIMNKISIKFRNYFYHFWLLSHGERDAKRTDGLSLLYNHQLDHQVCWLLYEAKEGVDDIQEILCRGAFNLISKRPSIPLNSSSSRSQRKRGPARTLLLLPLSLRRDALRVRQQVEILFVQLIWQINRRGRVGRFSVEGRRRQETLVAVTANSTLYADHRHHRRSGGPGRLDQWVERLLHGKLRGGGGGGEVEWSRCVVQ